MWLLTEVTGGAAGNFQLRDDNHDMAYNASTAANDACKLLLAYYINANVYL